MAIDDLTPLRFDDLVRMAARHTWSSRPASPGTPAQGEVWLIRWDEVDELGIVTAADETTARIAPISFDGLRSADERFLVAVQGYGDAVALPHLSREVPTITLDSVIALAEVPRALAPGQLIASEIEAGIAQALQDAASWRPGPRALDIPAMLRDVRAPLKDLAASLGMASNETLRLLRGTLLPSRGQAEAIGSLLRVPVEAVLGGTISVPDELRDAISVRSFRGAIEALSQRHAWSNSAAWLNVAQGVLVPQYRQTAREVDWRSRADHWVEANLD